MNKTIKISCKIGNIVKEVQDINEKDEIAILIEKLDIPDKRAKIIFNRFTYGLYSKFTFSEIGLHDGDRCVVTWQGLAAEYNLE